jgi:DNA repair protein RadA/Sms
MAKTKTVWSCNECGHQQAKWAGQCPSCSQWNTLQEEVELKEAPRFAAREGASSTPQVVRITEVIVQESVRLETGGKEFDQLLGGGIVQGSLTLVGGEPGIGKSTLTLQLSNGLAQKGLKVLYVCGEESIAQTSLRGRRLGVTSPNLFLLSETRLDAISLQIELLKPDFVVIDSIQIIYKPEIPSTPGSVAQVRECTMELMHLAKGSNTAIFVIGHVTKSGEIAGPKVLEHLVDTVLYFEGERHSNYRILRSIKNRFGPTDEIAVFQMLGHGLREITNPSELFLDDRQQRVPGSVVVATLEGTRPLLVELQALVARSGFSNPTRRCSGLDPNRMALILAVMEKLCGIQLYQCDVFLSVVGGIKILEPSIDLGILLAIASSWKEVALPPDTLVVGEVSLSGEIRSVQRLEQRLKEAVHMGFRRCIVPKRGLKNTSLQSLSQCQIIGVETVGDAIDAALGTSYPQ